MTDLTGVLRQLATGDTSCADFVYSSADLVEDGVLVKFADPVPLFRGRPLAHITRSLFEKIRAVAVEAGQPEPPLGDVGLILSVMLANAPQVHAGDDGNTPTGTYSVYFHAIGEWLFIERDGDTWTALRAGEH